MTQYVIWNKKSGHVTYTYDETLAEWARGWHIMEVDIYDEIYKELQMRRWSKEANTGPTSTEK